jgi:hypothetical protein
MDKMGRELWELAATNEILAKKMCGQIPSRESKDDCGPVGSLLSRTRVGDSEGGNGTSEEVSLMCRRTMAPDEEVEAIDVEGGVDAEVSGDVRVIVLAVVSMPPCVAMARVVPGSKTAEMRRLSMAVS